jgi:hypothetical protein
MLARIRNYSGVRGMAKLMFLLIAAGAFASCASKEPAPLVSDASSTQRESALPWNKQEKWEGTGQLGGMPGLTER